MLKDNTQKSTFAIAVAASWVLATHSPAATLYWDGTSTTADADGGNGTWTAADSWDDAATGGANATWNSATPDSAVFGGAAGTVNLGGIVTAANLHFDTAGYVIDTNNAANSNAFNLTINGLSGAAAAIRNSNSLATPVATTVTLQMASDTVWGGTIGSGGERIGVTVTGGKSLTVAKVERTGGFSQTTLNINGSGTKLILTGTGSNYSGNFVNVGAGATFDLGSNGNFNTRASTLNASGTLTASGTARIVDNNGNSASNLAGFLTGTLAVEQADTNNAMTISNNGNTYSGGTFITNNSTINATADNALGIGAVSISNSSGTATLNLTSVAPIIGALASSNAGTKQVVLGTTGVDTTLTVGGLGTSTSFGGTISDFSANDVGSLKKVGAGTLTLSGTNTYTGSTTINAGTILLSSTGSITNSNLVDLGPGGKLDVASQTFAMSGGQTFKFRIDPAGAGLAGLINAASLNISAGVVDFATLGTLNDPAYVLASYTSKSGTMFASVSNLPSGYTIDYDYNGGTQIALVVPEPASIGLLAAAALVMRRRRN